MEIKAKEIIVDGNTSYKYYKPKFCCKALEENPSPDAIKAELEKNFVIGAHKAFAITRLMKKAHFILVSALDKELAKKLLFESVDDVDAAMKLAEKYVGKDYKVLLMPQGSLTVPVLKK